MSNFVHPTAIVESDVNIGDNNYIGPYCHLYSGVEIGNDNRFEGYVSLGSSAEKRGFFSIQSQYGVNVGNSNIVREFVTINAGSRRLTQMRNGCIMLRGSHLSHDSILEDNVTLSCTVMIGGESYVMTGANLGLGAVIHQFSVVGSYSMIGMGAICTKTLAIKPGGIYVGNPARYLHPNSIGLARNNIDAQKLLDEEARWSEIVDSNKR